MVTVLKRHNIPVTVQSTFWSSKQDVTKRDEKTLFRMFSCGSVCEFGCRQEPYDAKNEGEWIEKGLDPARVAWARVALPDNELLSAVLLYVLSVSPSLTRSTEVVCLEHHRRFSCTMFACYYFIMTSSSRYPAAPPVYPDLFFILCSFFFLKGRVSSFPLTTCISPVPQMITKPNFSCEIPPTVSPRCGCIIRKRMPWLKRRNAKLILHFLGIFLPLFPHPFALVLFCFQAVLISPLAGSKQVGHVWHNPLTCSQA